MNKITALGVFLLMMISGEAQALWELVPQRVVQANIRAQEAEERAEKARNSGDMPVSGYDQPEDDVRDVTEGEVLSCPVAYNGECL